MLLHISYLTKKQEIINHLKTMGINIIITSYYTNGLTFIPKNKKLIQLLNKHFNFNLTLEEK